MLGAQISATVPNTGIVALLTLLFLATVAVGSSQAQTYTVLHAFGAGTDGAVPLPIIRDAQGNIYGTTKFGGIVSCGLDTCGTVYKVDSAGNETVLYRFEGGNNGYGPYAGLVQDAKGNLYGTTQGNGYVGGASVVFKVDPAGQQTVLYVADGGDACCLDSPVAVDAEGNVYGMSPFAGDSNCSYDQSGLGCGTLFKLSPGGKFTVLHTFHGKDGSEPEGGLVLDAKGNVYGTAYFGGKSGFCHPSPGDYYEEGCGTIYKVDTTGKFTVLHTFAGPGEGSAPLGLTIDSAGNLYGIAQWGGDDKHYPDHKYGFGTVFKLDASGTFSVLFTFHKTDNYYASHLVRDSKGNLYGIQQANNGALGGGCLFRVDPKGSYTDLYNFTWEESGDPFIPSMGLVLGSDGDFYGSTPIGGSAEPECNDEGFTQGCGSVFHLTLSAESKRR